jgi:hypothetical protein
MHRLRGVIALLAALFAPTLLPSQSPTPNLSPERTSALRETWQLAQTDIFAHSEEYREPDIAVTLDEPQYLIAIARVTSIQLPEPGSRLDTKYTLHVEQFLRGASDVKELHAESMFSPPRPQDIGKPTRGGGPHRTTLDLVPPKVGTLYVVGYRFLYEDGMRAYIPGAIDLSDPTQVSLLPEVQRLLNIESLAGTVSVQPYIAGLDDAVPWIRDLSAQHLIESDNCEATPDCVDAILTTIRRLLYSKKPIERFEALKLLEPLAQPMGNRKQGPNGLPLMSTPAVREMLLSTLSDSNVALGDKAFEELQLYDFYHAALPGECIEIVPILRNALRLASDEAKPKSFVGPFGGTFACTPAE